mgnify:CR=1 FL=1
MQGLDIHSVYPLSPFSDKFDAIEEEDEFECIHEQIPHEKRILHIDAVFYLDIFCVH